MVKSLRERAEIATKEVQDILGVSEDTHPKEIADALERVALVSERMEQGEGTIGRFITDDAVYEDVDGALAEARAALREVRRAAEETQEQIPSTILLSIFGSLF